VASLQRRRILKKSSGRIVFWENRKLILLILLVLANVGALALRWNSGTGHSGVSRGRANQGGTEARKIFDPEVRLTELKEEVPVLGGEQRNIFTYYQPPPPVLAKEEEEIAEEPQAVCGDRTCQEGEDYQNCPTDCPPRPVLPEITLRYIGYLHEPQGAVVFLTDGREVYMGRVNDVIANKYRVLKITDESVELGYLQYNESRTIRFQGG